MNDDPTLFPGAPDGVDRRKPSEPVPVSIATPVPIPVQVVSAKGPTGLPQQSQLADPSIAATTTFQQDLTSAGQRHINVMWERTQQVIAICVTVITLIVCAYLVGHGDAATAVPAFLLLSNVFFLVVGTYFQRTNHTKTGGVGPNESTR